MNSVGQSLRCGPADVGFDAADVSDQCAPATCSCDSMDLVRNAMDRSRYDCEIPFCITVSRVSHKGIDQTGIHSGLQVFWISSDADDPARQPTLLCGGGD